MKDEEIVETIYRSNMEDNNIRKEELVKGFKIKHRMKRKGGEGKGVRLLENLLVECTCPRYGHVAKYCKDTEPTCGHCSGKHSTRECKEGKERMRCCNCEREGRGGEGHTIRGLGLRCLYGTWNIKQSCKAKEGITRTGNSRTSGLS
ncbi:hypothetical protein J6590_105148 [Homalodisca vitripennis]|nr:hypothetical protein J6590_105148 [Homalodisca vitripennis]